MNRKIISLAILLIIISGFLCGCTEEKNESKTLYVDTAGGKDYLSIQTAIDASSDGDTVYVYSGIYNENIEVDKSITLIGEDKNKVFIDGEGGDNSISNILVNISVNNVDIKGFTIENSGSEFLNVGIWVYNSYDVTIEDNILRNHGMGIFLINESRNILVKDNEITNNHYSGIFDASSGNCIFSNNKIFDNNDAMNINSNSNIISNNNLSYNKLHSLTIEGDYNLISNNSILSNNWWGIKIEESTENIISDNFLKNHSWYSISIFNSFNNNITKNIITNNSQDGIYLYNSYDNLISGNEITDSYNGINVGSNCYDNDLENNNFMNNSIDIKY